MIGGDVKAYTILGVWQEDELDPESVKYLFLDPHYAGSDQSPKDILKKGWCGWKNPQKFL